MDPRDQRVQASLVPPHRGGLQHLRDAVALLEPKATAEELDDYRRFVLNLANKVASAHREDGERVSAAEQAAIEEIAASLGTTAP